VSTFLTRGLTYKCYLSQVSHSVYFIRLFICSMADYVFGPAVGVGIARMNAQLAQTAPKGDVSTSETVVPLNLREKLVRVPASKLLAGHLVAQVDMNVGGEPLINIIFQVIQVVGKVALTAGFVLLLRAQDHAFCPLNLVFPLKEDDYVFAFNSAGLDDLIHGPISDLFKCRNDDVSSLVPFEEVLVSPRGASGVAVAGSGKPISASLAADIVCAQALANLCMQNIQVLENYMPGDSITFGPHAVNMVLGSIQPNSPMLLSPFASPNVLGALMSVSFNLHQHLKYPTQGSSKKETAVSFFWAIGFGADPAATLSNKIIVEALEMTFRWFDLISMHMDAGSVSNGWYSAAAQGILKLFNKFSANNVLAWSPAFNAAICQEFFAHMETLFKKPVPSPRATAVLEREFIGLITTMFNFSLLSAKYREWVFLFPAEAAAWSQQGVSDQGVIEGLPPFAGISMIQPVSGISSESSEEAPAKKAKKSTSAKSKSSKKATAQPATSKVVPIPPPRTVGAGTRGTSATLADKICRYHAKHIYLDMSECTVVNCQFHHQDDAKDFTKSEMLKWFNVQIIW